MKKLLALMLVLMLLPLCAAVCETEEPAWITPKDLAGQWKLTTITDLDGSNPQPASQFDPRVYFEFEADSCVFHYYSKASRDPGGKGSIEYEIWDYNTIGFKGFDGYDFFFIYDREKDTLFGGFGGVYGFNGAIYERLQPDETIPEAYFSLPDA